MITLTFVLIFQAERVQVKIQELLLPRLVEEARDRPLRNS